MASCPSPSELAGTPLFNKQGELVGLVDKDQSVLTTEQIHADLIALRVILE